MSSKLLNYAKLLPSAAGVVAQEPGRLLPRLFSIKKLHYLRSLDQTARTETVYSKSQQGQGSGLQILPVSRQIQLHSLHWVRTGRRQSQTRMPQVAWKPHTPGEGTLLSPD